MNHNMLIKRHSFDMLLVHSSLSGCEIRNILEKEEIASLQHYVHDRIGMGLYDNDNDIQQEYIRLIVDDTLYKRSKNKYEGGFGDNGKSLVVTIDTLDSLFLHSTLSEYEMKYILEREETSTLLHFVHKRIDALKLCNHKHQYIRLILDYIHENKEKNRMCNCNSNCDCDNKNNAKAMLNGLALLEDECIARRVISEFNLSTLRFIVSQGNDKMDYNKDEWDNRESLVGIIVDNLFSWERNYKFDAKVKILREAPDNFGYTITYSKKNTKYDVDESIISEGNFKSRKDAKRTAGSRLKVLHHDFTDGLVTLDE